MFVTDTMLTFSSSKLTITWWDFIFDVLKFDRQARTSILFIIDYENMKDYITFQFSIYFWRKLLVGSYNQSNVHSKWERKLLKINHTQTRVNNMPLIGNVLMWLLLLLPKSYFHNWSIYEEKNYVHLLLLLCVINCFSNSRTKRLSH